MWPQWVTVTAQRPTAHSPGSVMSRGGLENLFPARLTTGDQAQVRKKMILRDSMLFQWARTHSATVCKPWAQFRLLLPAQKVWEKIALGGVHQKRDIVDT